VKSKPQRGDVIQVEVGEKPADPVTIRLAGHPFTYLVKVKLTDTGPKLVELTMIADTGHAVDYEMLRAVPARMLAYTAAQHLDRLRSARPGAAPACMQFAEDKESPPTGARMVALAERAQSLGLPVRPTVAAQLGVSKTTVDRQLKKAKAQGLIGPLPKRPSPKQRDTTTK